MYRLLTDLSKSQFIWRNWNIYKGLHVHIWYESTSMSPFVSDYIFCFQDLIWKEVYNWYADVEYRHTCFSSFNVFNVFIRCIWLNATYIIPICYPTILQCNRSIVPTLCCLKCPVIWSFVFESRIIIENDFISDFEVMVYSFIIFAWSQCT